MGGTSKDGTAGYYGVAPTLGLVPPNPAQTGQSALRARLRAAWGDRAAEVEGQYPLSRFGSLPNSAQAAFIQASGQRLLLYYFTVLLLYYYTTLL